MTITHARRFFLTMSALFIFANTAFAQNDAATGTQPARAAAAASSPIVNASVGDGRVRFSVPGQSLQMRLEIYNASGELMFDSGLRQGSLLDWKPADASQALTDGSYLSIVTVQDFQGKLRQRIGSLSLQAGQVTLKRMSKDELTAAQAKALSASVQAQKIDSEAGEIAVMREGKERAATVGAHDGQDGQVTTTKGALTFRTGNLFSGAEREHMRITPEGRIGVGTDKPEATLDVAGTIRVRGGIVFADGTVLNSASATRSPGASPTTLINGANGIEDLNVSGVGTVNRLTKWSDSSGALGNSTVTEVGGNVGIGTDDPSQALHVKGKALFQNTGTASLFIVDRTDGKIAALGAGGVSSTLAYDATGIFKIETNSRTNIAAGLFGTGAITRFTIDGSGNVGIGSAAPTERLDLAGNLRINGAGSGIIFPDGSKMTTATAGGGNTPSGTTLISAINDPATTGLINANRLSANVARLNAANNWSGANIFNLGLSANNALITNVGNPVSAGDAVNKVYADSNFIKFVPGAEQLSIGDANGTAPMINLRGGSTCCSGPGGHTPAWFKVFQNGSFVATGNLGVGVSPMQGKGYRTSWDSYKGAFRSGYADNEWDDATVGFFSWAGGSNSTAEGLYAFAFGDTNFARSTSSIAFGSGNEVKGAAGFSAGASNRVCDTYGVAFGNRAQSGGPLINGKCDPNTFNIRGLSAVAIGYYVTADQDHTTAMGKFATNNGFAGTFIWSDGSATASTDTFRNTANNEFAARATGGFRFRTNLGGTTGCNLPAGSGVFNCTSSRATKENFLLMNGEDVLSRLRAVPISTWNYISEGQGVKHMGPMAEDFYKAFGLGTDERSIGVMDASGVSLAAVKALDARTAQLQERTVEVEKLRSEVQALRAANAAMEQRLAAIEQSIQRQQERTPAERAVTSTTTSGRGSER